MSGPGAGVDAPAAAGRRVLERYRLERRLGAGGFGVVWQGWDEKLEREVAVKAIPREGADTRVEREARAAARLNHPAIVALYELAADEHDVFLVSELVHGRSLLELLGAGALADRDVARVGAVLCDALAHAHRRGVVHRDVKPQNVIVVAEPAAGSGFAKLTDFGVAHLASGETLTRTGDVVGTLAYMAPEQAEGRRASGASDVYSLALTLFEALTGDNPVRGAGPAATARRLGLPLPALLERRPDLPAALGAALDAALDVDPAARPAPAELAAALRAAEPMLARAGGLEELATLRRVGLAGGSQAAWAGEGATVPLGRRGEASPGAGVEERMVALARAGEAASSSARAAALLARLAAGAGAGGLLLLALTAPAVAPPFSALAVAAGVALLTALLPRLGWLGGAALACVWLASPEAGRAGTALVVLAALAPVPLLLPRAGLLWSVPALAPLLGVIGIAPAFVALAALVPPRRRPAARARPLGGSMRRAGLAAAGFAWLAAAELITGRALLFGAPDAARAAADWQGSPTAAVSDALAPLFSSPTLAPALVFAAFAPLLRPLLHGRSLALDVLAAAAWATGLALALAWTAQLIGVATALGEPRGGVAGAFLGGLAAVAAVASAAAAEPSSRGRHGELGDYPEGAT